MFLNIKEEIKLIIIYSNILIFIFNLLPIYPLDGGRIIKSLLKLKYKRQFAEKVVNQIANILLVIITTLSSILIMYYKNISIIFVIAYLWFIVIKENRKHEIKRKVYNIIEKETQTIDFK